MQKKFFYFILSIIPPLLFYLIALGYLSQFSMGRVKKELEKKQIFDKNPSEILNFLPSLFENHPHLLAVTLNDIRGFRWGSVYVNSQLADLSLQSLLKENYTQNTQITEKVFVYVLKEKNHYFSFFVYDKWLFREALKLFPKIFPNYGIYLFIYVMVGFFIYLGYFLFHKKKKNLAHSRDLPLSLKKDFKTKKSLDDSFVINTQKEIWHFVEELRKDISLEKAQLFLYEKNTWQPYLHIHGKILVKGKLADVAPEILEISHFDHPLTNENKEELFIPLRWDGEMLGSLWLKKTSAFSHEEIYEIYRASIPLSSELYRYLKLEKALFDPETGFYNKNYLFLILKERFLSQNPYYVAGLAIPNFERISQKKMQLWAKNLLYLLSTKSPKIDIFRININSFALLFSTLESEEKVKSTLAEITKLTEKEFSLSVITSVLKSPESLSGLKSFIQNLLLSVEKKGNTEIPISYSL